MADLLHKKWQHGYLPINFKKAKENIVESKRGSRETRKAEGKETGKDTVGGQERPEEKEERM